VKKAIVLGVLAVGVVLWWMPEPEFSLKRVSAASSEAWGVRGTLPEEERAIQKALSQPFTYMGCGAQAYVFFSEDGTSVLKLLKKKRFEVPAWIRFMPPLPYKRKKIAAKRENLIKDFTSYQIAYNELQEETGLLLVHLDDRPLPYSVTLMDQNKKVHTVHLGDYVFILQKRGELVYPVLTRYVKEGNRVAAQESLTALVHLLKARLDKGVADRDPNFSKNYAFLDGKALEIDIGRFSHATPTVPMIPQNFKQWLSDLSPELHAHFEQQLGQLTK
jgi:hypothetical protein